MRFGLGAFLVSVAILALGLVGEARAGPGQAGADTSTRRLVQHGARGAVTYEPPVDAPVTDPFRAPLTPYGPGNRGIEFATVPGTAVRAAADGVVVFAGAVAGGLHVTVAHRDGIRTSYSFLAAIRVREDQKVRGGDAVGIAAEMLHVGARRGDFYIDPASLWGGPVGPPVVHLVPLDGHQPGRRLSDGTGSERSRLLGIGSKKLLALGAGAGRGAAEGVGTRPP